jgi:SAM-dependent methyltransferase
MNSPVCPACGSAAFQPKRRTPKFDVTMGVCGGCGLAYATPLVGTTTGQGYLDGAARRFDTQAALAAKKVPRLVEYWARMLGRRPVSVLEIGCATGEYCAAMRSLGLAWQGVDIDEQMLEFCRARGFPATTLQEIQGRYDVIFLSQVLEHVTEPRAFLERLGALMAPGAIIHLDVPNHDSLTSLYRRLHWRHQAYGFLQPMYHLIAYGSRPLAALMKSAGFDILHLGAHANDDPVFGQPRLRNSLPKAIAYRVADAIGRGSLLVCVARRAGHVGGSSSCGSSAPAAAT